VSALGAQVKAEVDMTLRRGETLLLTVGIPVMLLVFFSSVHVLPLGTTKPINFLAPGILALAIMSTAMTSLSIATGFERSYGVLKRLGTTPLGRPRLIGAKIASVVVVEIVQAIVLVPIAFGLGWRPGGGPAAVVLAVVVMVLATVAFGGVGMVLAGTLRAEVNLAASNGLYLVLLLLGGMIIPIGKLPSVLRGLADALPAKALSSGLHSIFVLGSVPVADWVVLVIWALAAPALAAVTFRWE
jgi:ABC-2 type transport system permease protein